jgi:hypothetical protein
MNHVGDSTELHDRPCRIDVKIRPAKDQYEASNEVRNYKSLEAAASAPAKSVAAPPAKQASAPAAKAGGGKPPWAKN